MIGDMLILVCLLCVSGHMSPLGEFKIVPNIGKIGGGRVMGVIVIYVKHTVFSASLFSSFFANTLVRLKCEYFEMKCKTMKAEV